jgi:outer membrane receptor protein involved in Fe transport
LVIIFFYADRHHFTGDNLMKNTIRNYLVANFLLVAVFCYQPSLAQVSGGDSDEEPIIEEILVTATKRGAQALQDIPMSIQAFTGEDLERRGVLEFTDYARSISGLSFNDEGPGDKKYIIRGTTSIGAATTGVYFDDIVITGNNRQDGGGRQPDIRLVDMERLEVLKGPQGTLYGASSMSGTIRMITNKPDATESYGAFNTSVGATRGSDDINFDADVMLNIPLVQDKLAARLVAYRGDDTGNIDDLLDYGIGGLGVEGANSVTVEGGRIALRWLINDDAHLDAMWLHQDTNTDGATWYQPLFGRFQQRNYQRLQWNESLDAYNLALEWGTDHGTFTASGSFLDREIHYRFPAVRILCFLFTGGLAADNPACKSPGPDPLALTFNGFLDQPQDRSIFSSELRYASDWDGRIQLVAGVFFQDEDADWNSVVSFADIDGSELPKSDPFNLLVNRRINGTIEQRTVFGEFSYDFTDRLTGIVGFRYFEFDIDETGQNLVTRNRPVDADPVPTSSKEDDITPKLGLTYDLTDNVVLYGTYGEGFRAGGNNEPDFLTNEVFPPFTSDSLVAYELGIKGLFSDGKLQLDAAAYLIDWSDLQQRVRSGSGNFLIVGNVGEAQITGLEIGGFWVPSIDSNFTFGGNVTFSQAELSEDAPDDVGEFAGQDGDRIPDIPELTGNLFAEYSRPIAGGNWDMLARLDYAYVGDSFRAFRPDDPRQREQGDYSLVGFRITFEDGERFRVGIFADNLFDEDAVVTWFADPSQRRPDQIIPVQSRTLGVSFGYKF